MKCALDFWPTFASFQPNIWLWFASICFIECISSVYYSGLLYSVFSTCRFAIYVWAIFQIGFQWRTSKKDQLNEQFLYFWRFTLYIVPASKSAKALFPNNNFQYSKTKNFFHIKPAVTLVYVNDLRLRQITFSWKSLIHMNARILAWRTYKNSFWLIHP